MVRCRTICGGLIVTLMVLMSASDALALRIHDRRSPKNRERARRVRTDFIVLHTTEGAPKGALTKLRKNGEAHYLVNRDGSVFRIVDKDRVAFHAGRSLWDGKADLDRVSVGIEVVGYHNKEHRPAQVAALKELIRQLRGIYGVPAERVLTHAQVAYGRPNRYHRYDHRGRKRCAMSLGTTAMRKALGLNAGPSRDPDVDAGRLRVADKKLFKRLFPQVALTRRGRPRRVPARPSRLAMRNAKAAQAAAPKAPKVTAPKAPPAKTTASKAKAPSPAEVQAKLAKVRAPKKSAVHARKSVRAANPRGRGGLCTVNRRASPAKRLVGPRYAEASTIYLLPDGRVRTGAQLARKQASLLKTLPKGTRVLKDKTFGGYVKASRAPSEICGSSWRSKETVYRFPNGKLVAGHKVNPARLPKATMVFCAS